MEKNVSNPKKEPTILFVNKEREPLFSKKNRKLLSDPMDDNNPITVQVLGICSALAITVQLKPAIVMSVSRNARSMTVIFTLELKEKVF